MNEKITLKIARHLINSIYRDLSKVELLDLVYSHAAQDNCCEIILKLVNVIKETNILNKEYLNKIYNCIPSGNKKNPLSEVKLNKFLLYANNHNKFEICKYLIRYKVFNDLWFIMLTLIFNNISYLENKELYVIFLFTEKELYKRSYKSKKVFFNYFKLILEENKKYNVKNIIYEIAEIKNIISTTSTKQISFYGIKKIYLYGSYVKKTNNEFSDIDLIIFSDISDINLDICETLLCEYFEQKFKSSCDIHIHINSRRLTSFERNIMKNSILLLNYEE